MKSQLSSFAVSSFAVSIFAALSVVSADAALVAYWNFNGLSISSASTPGSGGVPTDIPADSGAGTVSLSSWLGTVDDFAGTTINNSGATVAGAALSLIASGGTAGPYPGNGSSITISFPMTDLENPVLTLATQRTPTGFGANQVAYSTDGSNYTNFGASYTPAANFASQIWDFSAIDALDRAASVFLKITFGGATSNTGNNRIDNIQINAVPEIASGLLGALGLLGILRRRR
jgi:hypothetical protein